MLDGSQPAKRKTVVPRPSRILPFGATCFALLAVFILVRAAASFLPCKAWGASGYLCAAPYLGLSLGRSHTVIAERGIAEGARIANRLDFLSFRRTRFTIDEHGYRNGPEMSLAIPKVVLFGSSFSLGLALNDDETFSARLNQRLGDVIYNASTTFNPYLSSDRIVETARASGMTHGWILVEVLNREPFHYVAGADPEDASLRNALKQQLKGLRNSVASAVNWAPAVSLERRILHPAALTQTAALLNMRLYDDRLLPNPFKRQYSEEQLSTGRHVLVFPEDKQFAQKPASPRATASALIRLRDDLDRQGYRLAVFLLPNSYSVYYPLYRDHPARDASAAYMAELAAMMSDNGVPLLNLLPAMREAARKELSSGEMIYYPDDAHWNRRGCAIAAEIAAPWLDDLLHASAAAGE